MFVIAAQSYLDCTYTICRQEGVSRLLTDRVHRGLAAAARQQLLEVQAGLLCIGRWGASGYVELVTD